MAEEKTIEIQARDEEIKGHYSNLMQISHNKEEFILDFFFTAPPKGLLISRVIVSPSHLKRMVSVMSKNLSEYEKKFKEIEEGGRQEGEIGFKTSL